MTPREPFPIDSSPAVPELTPAAIAARREARLKTGRDGGYTGREMLDIAARNFNEANRQRKVATNRLGRRAEKAQAKADEWLRTAATQIRISQATPLDRPYLHALSLDRIQRIKGEVVAAFNKDSAELAVDTHRRIHDQRNRVRVEAGG